MTIFPRYVSSRFKDLRVGISSYSEDRTALEVIGNVGVGTTNPDVAVGTGNTAKLAVGVATANTIHAKQYFGDENNNFIASGAGSGQVGIDSGATFNILMGRETGKLLTTGSRNILMGLMSGCDMTTAFCNIGLGYNSLRSATTGGGNIAIGQKAGRELTVGTSNIFIGNNSGIANTSGYRNIVIGDGADGFGFNNHSGRVNVFIGAESARANYFSGSKSTFEGNTFLGYRSGWAAFGCCGGLNFPTSTFGCNTVIGHCAGALFGGTPLSGYADIIENVYIGAKSATFNLGGCNVLLGSYVNVRTGPNPVAGFGITASVGNLNIGIGHSVCLAKQIGNRQLAIGHSDFQWIHGDSNYNVGIGITDPSNAVSSSDTQKLAVGILTAHNVFASRYQGDENRNFFAGEFAGSTGTFNNTAACLNVAIGNSAGSNLNASGSYVANQNVLIGACVGTSMTTSCYNTVVGAKAGISLTNRSAYSNVLLGFCAGRCIQGARNIAIGQIALDRLDPNSYGNIGIGYKAGRNIECRATTRNISIGQLAGDGAITGGKNAFLGNYAGRNMATGEGGTACCNLILGNDAGLFIEGAHEIYENVLLGSRAGYFGRGLGITTAFSKNVLIGTCAGRFIKGSCNIYIGPEAAANSYWCHCGVSNIGIGQSIQMPDRLGSNQLAIGQTSQYWITGDQSFNVGIGSTIPQTKLDVGGDLNVSGLSTFGDVAQFRDTVRLGRPHCEGVEDGVPGRFTLYNGNSAFPAVMTFQNHLYIEPMIQVRIGPVYNYLRIYNYNGRGQIQFGNNGSTKTGLDIHGYGSLSMRVSNKEGVGIGSTSADVSLGYEGSRKLMTSGIGVTIFNQLDTTNLNISGVSTFADAIDANGTLDVDGHTELDDLNVSGVATFAGSASFEGNVSIAGTLTYEDVTNVDSIGIITAGNGLRVTQGGINVTAGISTFGGNIDANGNLDVDGQTDLDVLNVSDTATFSALVDVNNRLDVVGGANVDQLNVSGVSTFVGVLTATNIFADRYHGDQNNNFYAGPFVGSGAAGITSGATANIGIGLSLGTKISSGYRNILFGVCSGPEITTGYKNILIGCHNARTLSTGQNNIALGARSLDCMATGSYNIAMGFRAGRQQGCLSNSSLNDHCYDIYLGHTAGDNRYLRGLANVYLGYRAGQGGCTDNPDNCNNSNIFVGAMAGEGLSGSGICNNVLIGQQSALFSEGSGIGTIFASNVFLGSKAGYSHRGSCNIFVGAYAGCSTSGNFNAGIGEANIGIGLSVQLPEFRGSNQLAIGQTSQYWITGDQYFNVGIGSTVPKAKLDIGGSLNVSGVGTFNGRVGINTDILRSVPALDINLPQDFSGQNLSYSGEGGVGLINLGNKTFPNASGFRSTLGLKQCVEIGGTQTIDSSSPGGFPQVHGMYNFLTKNKGNVQNIDRLQFIGFYNQLSWSDQNTLRQYRGIQDDLGYYGADANGKTSSFFEAKSIGLIPSDGKTQTINNIIGERTTIRAFSGIATVTVGQTWKGHQTSLQISAGSGRTTNAVINNAVFYNTSENWGTQGSGTKNATIQNLYGLKLNPPNNADGLVINNNYGIYQGWSNASNYFAGNVGVGTTIATNAVSVGNTAKLAVGILTAHNVFANQYHGDSAENFYVGLTAGGGAASVAAGGDTNIAIGAQNGCNLTSGSCNILLGRCVGISLTTGSRNISMGHRAGNCLTTGSHNVFIGSYAGCQINTGSVNIAIGRESGVTSGLGTIFDGTSNHQNISIGDEAGRIRMTGTGNIAIGRESGEGAASLTPFGTNDHNIFIGCHAGNNIGNLNYGGCNTANNIMIGKHAGRNVNRSCCASNSLNENVMIGLEAGYDSHGACNIYIGSQAVRTCQPAMGVRYSGDQNIGIGQSVNLPKFIGSNQLAIGQCTNYWITGDCDYNVGIGITNPSVAVVGAGSTHKLAVGVVTAYQVFAEKYQGDIDRNIVMGRCAGIAITPASTETCHNVILGDRAGEKLFAGDSNVFIGCHAGIAATDTCNNIYIGKEAGAQNCSCYSYGNIAIGHKALCHSPSNNNSIAIGCCAAFFHNTANIIAIGCHAGKCAMSPGIYIGRRAGEKAFSGSNVFIGVNAGMVQEYYGNNVMLGNNAGCCSICGQFNTFVGHGAAMGNRLGSLNVAIGRCAGPSHNTSEGALTKSPTGGLNFYAGFKTGICIVDGEGNVLLGNHSGIGYTSGSHNISIGSTAGPQTCGASGCNNITFGYETGNSITSGGENVLIGRCTGFSQTTAFTNTLIGACVGRRLTTGGGNIGFGRRAFDCVSTGLFNIAMGFRAGRNRQSEAGFPDPNYNISIGYQAADVYFYGGNCRNIYLGMNAADNLTQGDSTSTSCVCNNDNILIGSSVGNEIIVCGAFCRNILIGDNAGFNALGAGIGTDYVQNVLIGTKAGSRYNGNCNTFIGPYAGCSPSPGPRSTGIANIGIGLSVQMPDRFGSNQLAIGQTSKYWIVGDQNFNVGIGTTIPTNAVTCGNTQKLAVGILTSHRVFTQILSFTSGVGPNTTGQNIPSGANIAIGNTFTGNTFNNAVLNYGSISIGDCAGRRLNNGFKNVLIGDCAGSNITDGDNNVALGGCALGGNGGPTTGDENFAVGDSAGYNLTSGSHNIMFGDQTGGFTSTGGCNIFIGRRSGMGNQTGNFNIVLGNFAGYSNGNGSDNIFIGTCAMGARLNPSKTLVIGHYNQQWIHGDCDYNVGIGITNPSVAVVGAGDTQKLAVGILSAHNIFSNQLNITGVSTFSDNIILPDDKKIQLGDNQDLEILHDPSNGIIRSINSGGNMHVESKNHIELNVNYNPSNGSKQNALKAIAGQGVSLYYAGATKLNTTNTGASVNGQLDTTDLNVSGVSTFSGITTTSDTLFANQLNVAGVSTFNGTVRVDGVLRVNSGNESTDRLQIGDSGQLRIYHAGHNYYRSQSGNHIFTVNGSEVAASMAPNGGVALFYDNVRRFRTHTDGAEVVGILTANGLAISGVSTFTSNSTFLDKVGIGTTNPIAELDVNVGSSITAFNVAGSEGQLFSVTNNLTSGSIFEVNDVSGMPSIDVNADGTIQLAPHGAGELVGIGTTVPTSKLHVVGDTLVTGISTFEEVRFANNNRLKFGDDLDLHIYHFAPTNNNFISAQNNSDLTISAGQIELMNQNHSAYYLKAEETGTIVYHNNAQRLATNGVGVTIYHQLDTTDLSAIGGNFTGIVTASDFVGGGINTSGTSTFTDLVTSDGLTVSGVSTFAGLVDINAGGQANTFKVEDLTAGRVVLAGTGGELEDNANLTFNGSTLGVTGNVSAVDGTFSGNVSIGGTLTYEDVTNIDSIGIVTARSGLKVGTGITFEADGDAYVTGIATLGRGSSGDVYLYNPANTALSGTENSVYGWKAKTYCQGLQVNSCLYLSRSGSNGLGLGYNNATGSSITANSGFLNISVPHGPPMRFYASCFEFRHNHNARQSAFFNTNGAIQLNHNGNKRFETTNDGVLVSGVTTTTNLNVTGVSTHVGITTFQSRVFIGAATTIDARLNVGNDIEIFSSGQVVRFRIPESSPHAILTYLDQPALQIGRGSTEYATFNSSFVRLKSNNLERLKVVSDGIEVSGVTDTLGLNVTTGVSTFAGNIDANGDLDVDGHTSLDDVLVTGFTTFFPTGGTKFLTTIEAENGMFVHNAGVSTFKTPVQIDAGATFNQLNLSGVSTFAGNINANGNIVGDDSTNISGINSVTATEYYGTGAIGSKLFARDAQSNLLAGHRSGIAITTGENTAQNNVAIGRDVARRMICGCYNVLLGDNVASRIHRGRYNVMLGVNVGSAFTHGTTGVTNNIFIGRCVAMNQTANVGSSIAIGLNAAKSGTSNSSVIIGSSAGQGVLGRTHSHNVFLGTNSGTGVSTGSNNIAIGNGAGRCISCASNNVYLGVNAGKCDFRGCGNIALGTNAMCSGNVGNQAGGKPSCNVVLGSNAGTAISSGDHNVFLGTNSGCSIVSGGYSVVIGYNSLACATTGNYSIALGYSAAKCVTTGSGNVAFGFCSLHNTTTGGCNFVVGNRALLCMTTGCFNLALGGCVGCIMTSGCRNIFLGDQAACCFVSGSNNIAIGCRVCVPLDTGSNQLAIGARCCYWLTGDSSYNVGIGSTTPQDQLDVGGTIRANGLNVSGVSTFSSDLNIAENIVHTGDTDTKISFPSNDTIKLETGDNHITVDDSKTVFLRNIRVGDYVSHSGVDSLGIKFMNGGTGNNGTHVGLGAEDNGTSGGINHKTFRVYRQGSSINRVNIDNFGNLNALQGFSVAGVSTFTGNINANGNIIGDDSTNISGINTVAANFYYGCGGIGSRLFQNDIFGNLIAGTNAGLAVTTTNNVKYNILIGCDAGSRINTSCYTVAIGKNAARCMTSGSGQNTAVGSNAGQKMGCCGGTGNGNTFLGFNAGNCGYNPTANTYIGYNAGMGHPDSTGGSGGSCNVAVGYNVAANIRGGNNNVLLGRYVGTSISTATDNFASGNFALACNLTGGGNITIGGEGLGKNISGSNNIAFGCRSLFCKTSGSFNVAIGYQSLYSNTLNGKNIAIGCKAGYAASNAANIMIGNIAGCLLNGSNNTFIGSYSGSKSTEATGNTFFGHNAGGCNTTGDTNTSIGCKAGMGNTTGNSNISIGHASGSQNCGSTGAANLSIGNFSGRNITSGLCNISIGECAGCDISTGGCNIAIGQDAGKKFHSSSKNIAIGRGIAVFSNVTGSGNVLMGDLVARRITSGAFNTFIGSSAGRYVTTANNNIGVGAQSSYCLSVGGDNIGLGACSNRCLTTASDNISIGRCSGYLNTTTHGNVSIGHSAGHRVGNKGENISIGSTSGGGCYSVAIGRFALSNCTNTGGYNVAIGMEAGCSMTTGANNVFVGQAAGQKNSSGNCNISLGVSAGKCNQTGCFNISIGMMSNNYAETSQNVAVGHRAQLKLQTGSQNVAMGDLAGYCIETSHGNVSIGQSAAYGLRGGSNNVSIGSSAGAGSCLGTDGATGDDNIYVGKFSGTNITTGHTNVFLGPYAGRASASSSANNNIGIGMNVGKCLTTGFNNIFFGKNAGLANTGGKANIFMGLFSGQANAGGSNNHFIGGLSGMQNTTGKQNNFMGFYAGAGNTSGDYNVFFGTAAAINNTTGSCTVAIGHHAARCQTTANATIAIGHCAGAGNTITGSDNILVGKSAGFAITTAFNNIFMGTCAGANTGIATENTFIGSCAGLCNTNGYKNVFIGFNAGKCHTTGVVNIAIGPDAGCCIKTGNTNTVTGHASGKHLCSGSGNTLYGSNAGCGINAGGCNTVVGRDAGKHLTSGSHNNIFGHFAGCKLVSGSSNLLMGNCAGYCVCGNSNVMLGRSSGFNRSGTKYNYNVLVGQNSGSSAGTLAVGNFDTLIGYNAGRYYTGSCSIGIGHSVQMPITDGMNQLAIGHDDNRWIVGTCDFNVGIGITTPTSKLHVGGDAVIVGVVTATDFDATSDIRLKTNIQPIDDPIAKVIQIEGVSFNWKKDNQPALGVIADQVEKILPELVHGGDPKTVNYNGLIGLLIEVVKDQQKQINTLSERISKLE